MNNDIECPNCGFSSDLDGFIVDSDDEIVCPQCDEVFSPEE